MNPTDKRESDRSRDPPKSVSSQPASIPGPTPNTYLPPLQTSAGVSYSEARSPTSGYPTSPPGSTVDHPAPRLHTQVSIYHLPHSGPHSAPVGAPHDSDDPHSDGYSGWPPPSSAGIAGAEDHFPSPRRVSHPTRLQTSTGDQQPTSGSDKSPQFQCDDCQSVFPRRHNLKSHAMVHSHDKPFICTTCSHQFRRQHDLKRHMKGHTGEKPFICPKCQRPFARMDALSRHLRAENGHACNMNQKVSRQGNVPTASPSSSHPLMEESRSPPRSIMTSLPIMKEAPPPSGQPPGSSSSLGKAHPLSITTKDPGSESEHRHPARPGGNQGYWSAPVPQSPPQNLKRHPTDPYLEAKLVGAPPPYTSGMRYGREPELLSSPHRRPSDAPVYRPAEDHPPYPDQRPVSARVPPTQPLPFSPDSAGTSYSSSLPRRISYPTMVTENLVAHAGPNPGDPSHINELHLPEPQTNIRSPGFSATWNRPISTTFPPLPASGSENWPSHERRLSYAGPPPIHGHSSLADPKGKGPAMSPGRSFGGEPSTPNSAGPNEGPFTRSWHGTYEPTRQGSSGGGINQAPAPEPSATNRSPGSAAYILELERKNEALQKEVADLRLQLDVTRPRRGSAPKRPLPDITTDPSAMGETGDDPRSAGGEKDRYAMKSPRLSGTHMYRFGPLPTLEGPSDSSLPRYLPDSSERPSQWSPMGFTSPTTTTSIPGGFASIPSYPDPAARSHRPPHPTTAPFPVYPSGPAGPGRGDGINHPHASGHPGPYDHRPDYSTSRPPFYPNAPLSRKSTHPSNMMFSEVGAKSHPASPTVVSSGDRPSIPTSTSMLPMGGKPPNHDHSTN
ncbi:hypothetical protein H4R33_004872 [Dimargaris cristalligena]|nr:hypothetical protein H4R33_004872 [Dimargaris cristalligena]